MNRRIFIQNSCLLAAGIFCAPPIAAAGWKESATLPDLGSFALEGSIPSLRGKVVYLDFWASWCAPCKASFPVLNKWQHEYGAKGFTVLGVSVDEKAVEMQEFLRKTPATFPIVRDAAHKLVGVADVSSMPTSFLIDRKGLVRLVHNGFRPKDEAVLAAKIVALLAEG